MKCKKQEHEPQTATATKQGSKTTYLSTRKYQLRLDHKYTVHFNDCFFTKGFGWLIPFTQNFYILPIYTNDV